MPSSKKLPMVQLAPVYPILHQILKPTFPNCLWSGSPQTPIIALTFDDGPHAQHTPQLLEVLKEYQITATFFCLGVCVERNPKITKQIYDHGHWLGIHGWNHKAFPSLTPSQLKLSLQKTQNIIATACDLPLDYVQKNIRDVRPPNGVFTPQTLKYLQQWHYRPVMWSIVPEDWLSPSIPTVIKRIMSQVRAGSLIVLHDGFYGGENVAQTVAQLIPLLRAQGYQFVTVDKLWHSIAADRESHLA